MSGLQFAQLINAHCERLHKNSIDIASDMRIDPSLVRRWRRGKQPPLRHDPVIRLASVLKLDLHQTEELLESAGFSPVYVNLLFPEGGKNYQFVKRIAHFLEEITLSSEEEEQLLLCMKKRLKKMGKTNKEQTQTT